MHSNWITNTSHTPTLASVFNKRIPQAKELSFLVGYFYFSGFEAILDALEKSSPNQTIRLLIGMDLEVHERSVIVSACLSSKREQESGEKKRKQHNEHTVRLHQETDFIDKNFYENRRSFP